MGRGKIGATPSGFGPGGARTYVALDGVDGVDAPPTLVIAGALDPITPVEDAREVSKRLSAVHLELPRSGHAPMLIEPCARKVLRTFLSGDTQPDTSCASEPPRAFS